MTLIGRGLLPDLPAVSRRRICAATLPAAAAAALGAALALAARGAGRRWGPAVGALIVVLFLAHDIFSQLLVASRFYG